MHDQCICFFFFFWYRVGSSCLKSKIKDTSLNCMAMFLTSIVLLIGVLLLNWCLICMHIYGYTWTCIYCDFVHNCLFYLCRDTHTSYSFHNLSFIFSLDFKVSVSYGTGLNPLHLSDLNEEYWLILTGSYVFS